MRSRGFTLLEALTVIAVLAIIATVGVPSFAALMDRNALASATNQSIAVLRGAQEEAVRLQEEIDVAVGTGGREFVIRLASDDTVLHRSPTLPRGITVSFDSPVTFNSEGAMTSKVDIHRVAIDRRP